MAGESGFWQALVIEAGVYMFMMLYLLSQDFYMITAFSAGNGFVKNPKLGFLALNDKNSKYINLDGCYRY